MTHPACSQEPIVRALIEKVARNSERCRHLEEGIHRIETKLDDLREKLERKFSEVDATLNGRLGFPGLVGRMAAVSLFLSVLGSIAVGVALFVLQRQAWALWTGGGLP